MLIGKLKHLIHDESGATAIEYSLLGTLVAIAIIGSFSLLGNSLTNMFDNGTADVIASQTAKIN